MRIAFIGQQDFGKAALEAFMARGDQVAGVFCMPDQPGAKPDALREAAQAKGLPLFQFASLRSSEARQAMRDLNADLAEPLLRSQPIGNDEPLARDFFIHIFQRAAAQNLGDIGTGMMSAYTDYVRSSWLKPVLAEALITGGHGNPEQWASLITPSEFQRGRAR